MNKITNPAPLTHDNDPVVAIVPIRQESLLGVRPWVVCSPEQAEKTVHVIRKTPNADVKIGTWVYPSYSSSIWYITPRVD